MIYQKPSGEPPPVQKPASGLGIVWVIFLWPLSIFAAYVAGTATRPSQATIKQAPPAVSSPLPSLPAPHVDDAPAPVQSGDLFETTPNEVVLYYRKNPVAAADWLKGKTIRITARTGGVSNNLFGGEKAAVLFETTLDRFLSPEVIYWFDGTYRDQIGGIRLGQTVTVEGRFEEAEFMGDLTFHGTGLWVR